MVWPIWKCDLNKVALKTKKKNKTKTNLPSKKNLWPKQFLFYLSRRHQVKRIKQEKTEGLDEEHIVAVFPHQEERDACGTNGKIAKHLQGKWVRAHHCTQKVTHITETITSMLKDTPQ